MTRPPDPASISGNADDPVTRRHLSLSFNQLLDLLGVDGHITRLWAEDSVDYLHLIVEPGRYTGGYIEDELAVTEKIDDNPTTCRFR